MSYTEGIARNFLRRFFLKKTLFLFFTKKRKSVPKEKETAGCL
jgi:hypothetical protein